MVGVVCSGGNGGGRDGVRYGGWYVVVMMDMSKSASIPISGVAIQTYGVVCDVVVSMMRIVAVARDECCWWCWWYW